MANTPFSWNPYVAPTQQFVQNPIGATNGNYGFITPSNTQLPTGTALTQFLTGNGTLTPDGITNRTVKYDGGLTREALYNSTGFLDGQLKTGFEGINTALTNFGGLGGLGGMSGASPVYRPNGAAVGQGASNGQPLPWGVSNPFNQTF